MHETLATVIQRQPRWSAGYVLSKLTIKQNEDFV